MLYCCMCREYFDFVIGVIWAKYSQFANSSKLLLGLGDLLVARKIINFYQPRHFTSFFWEYLIFYFKIFRDDVGWINPNRERERKRGCFETLNVPPTYWYDINNMCHFVRFRRLLLRVLSNKYLNAPIVTLTSSKKRQSESESDQSG